MVKIKADLHNHLGYRILKDRGGFDKVVDFASKKLGPEGILGVVDFRGLTEDHPFYRDFISMPSDYNRLYFGGWGFYIPEKRLHVIRGEEVAAFEYGREKHVLVVASSIGRPISPGRSLDDTLRAAEDAGGIIVAPHPFYVNGMFLNLEGPNNRERRHELASRLDAMEVHNGGAVIPFLAQQFANTSASVEYGVQIEKNPKLGALFVSDGHTLREVATSYTFLDLDSSWRKQGPDEMREELRFAIQSVKNPKGHRHDSTIPAILHALDVKFRKYRRSLSGS